MTELQREMALAERDERRTQDAQRSALLGRRAPAPAEQPAATRRSSREVRPEEARKSAMRELVAARGKQAARREEQDDEEEDDEEEDEGHGADEDETERRSAGDVDFGGSSSDEDETRSRRRAAGSSRRASSPLYSSDEDEGEEEEEASFEEVAAAVVRRSQLEAWHGEPFFARYIKGVFVRMAMGERTDPATGHREPRYVLARVEGLETRPPGVYKDVGQPWRSPYPFGPERTKTDVWLRVTRGGSERCAPMALVSNTPPTEAEYEGWQAAAKQADQRPLPRSAALKARENIAAASSYVYTSEDVQARLREKRAAGQLAHTALEIARLEHELAVAHEVADEAKAAEIQAALEAARSRSAVEPATTGKRSGNPAESINARNRAQNFQNALRNVSNAPQRAEGPDEDAPKGADGEDLDPFSRRATRPKVYWSTRGAREREEAEAAARAEEAERERAAADAAVREAEETVEGFEAEGPGLRARRVGFEVPLFDPEELTAAANLRLGSSGGPVPALGAMGRSLLGLSGAVQTASMHIEPAPGRRVLTIEDVEAQVGGHVAYA